MNSCQIGSRPGFCVLAATCALTVAGFGDPAAAYQLTAFAPAVFDANAGNLPAFDTAVGISGFTIEDFEDERLVAGVTVELEMRPINTVFPADLLVPFEEQPSPIWDGSVAGIGNPNFSDVAFRFDCGATSVGIGVADVESLLKLVINGGSQEFELHPVPPAGFVLHGVSPDQMKNGYLRVDVEPGNPPIEEIRFVQPAGGGPDAIYFDRLAVLFAPEVYWTSSGDPSTSHAIERARSDGTGREAVVTGGTLDDPEGVLVDGPTSRLFVANDSGKIERYDLAGGFEHDINPTQPVGDDFFGLASDPMTGKIYWTEADSGGSGFVMRRNADGSGSPEQVATLGSCPDPAGISFDPQGQKVYWACFTAEKIQRADAGGLGQTDTGAGATVENFILALDGTPVDVALDVPDRRIYWSVRGAGGGTNRVRSAPLADVSDRADVAVSNGQIGGLALDIVAVPPMVYWVNIGDGRVERRRLDGTDGGETFYETFATIDAPSTPFGMSICRPARRCGDGIVELAEECDDGNPDGGDGCSGSCRFEGQCADAVTCSAPCDEDADCGPSCGACERCGNEIVDPAETCDDGNVTAGDGCSPTCTCEGGICGDGVVSSLPECGVEECDDGNVAPGDGCDETCQTVCGDGIVVGAEQCDLEAQNGQPGSGCSATCTSTGRCTQAQTECASDVDCPPGEGCCGNTLPEGDEECDDGNLLNGDCCSSVCTNETTSECVPNCDNTFGPQFLPASMKAKFKDRDGNGTYEVWKTARHGHGGDFNLRFGQSVDPCSEEVRVVFLENDGTNGRTSLGDFKLQPEDWTKCLTKPEGTDDEIATFKDKTELISDTDGIRAAKIREREVRVKYKFRGSKLAQVFAPANVSACLPDCSGAAIGPIRVCIHIGDDAGTSLLTCTANKSASSVKCVSANCLPSGFPCAVASDCCSSSCSGAPGSKTCDP